MPCNFTCTKVFFSFRFIAILSKSYIQLLRDFSIVGPFPTHSASEYCVFSCSLWGRIERPQGRYWFPFMPINRLTAWEGCSFLSCVWRSLGNYGCEIRILLTIKWSRNWYIQLLTRHHSKTLNPNKNLPLLVKFRLLPYEFRVTWPICQEVFCVGVVWKKKFICKLLNSFIVQRVQGHTRLMPRRRK